MTWLPLVMLALVGQQVARDALRSILRDCAVKSSVTDLGGSR